MRIAVGIAFLFLFVSVHSAQDKNAQNSESEARIETLAKEAFDAHGGDKLRDMETLSMIGSVDVTASAANQAIPAKFIQVFSGEKYRLEVDGGFIQFVQTFDGVNTITSPSRGFTLPPINRVGLLLLQRLGQEGFTVSSLPDAKKKQLGFTITSPDGYYTDFILNKKSKRVKAYESSYYVAGREVMTLVEIDKYVEKGGIIIPSKFAQKFDVAGMTVYAVFKSKVITVNEEVADEMFTASK